MLSILLKTEKSFIAHPWCLLSIVGLEVYIAYSLSKLPLEWRDIFLFNNLSSTTEAVAYDMLQGIKDGKCKAWHMGFIFYDT